MTKLKEDKTLINRGALKINLTRPAVLVDLEEYENMQEEIALLHSKRLVKDIEEAEREYKNGKTIDWKKLQSELK